MTEKQQKKDGVQLARPGEGDPNEDDELQLKDISHTPPHGDGANRVWDGTRVYEQDTDNE